MPIILHCENGHKLRVNDSAVGKKVRCPTCEAVVLVTNNDEAASLDDDDLEEDGDKATATPIRKNRTGKSAKSKSGKKSEQQGNGLLIVGGILGVVVLVGVIGAVAFLFTRKPATDLAKKAAPAAVASPDTTTPPAVDAKPAAENKQPAETTTVAKPTDAAVTPVASQPSEPAAKPSTSETAGVQLTAGTNSESSTSITVTESSNAAANSAEKAAETAVTAPQTTETTKATEITQAGLHVWDAGAADPGAKGQPSLVERGTTWVAVTPDKIESHQFVGDCVIENEKVWLHIPRVQSEPVKLAAKDKDSAESVIPITIFGAKSKEEDPRISRVTELSDDSTLVTFGMESGGPTVACRVTKGKYWIEVIPKEGAEQLTIGIKAKFIVLPTEFGEDEICDADQAVQKNYVSIPLPHENMVIALERQGNHMSLLTYPSIEQAGELTLGKDDTESEKEKEKDQGSNSIAKRVSAKFEGNSVFVCLLPQRNLWYSEVVTKKYGAPGHYPITDKDLYPGIWRIAGRILGKKGSMYYVSEFPETNLLFECRQSGTFESLFYFLSRPLDGASGEHTLTPLDIYRETLGGSDGNAYLLDTEVAGRLFHRDTKYRGVCGCIDDMRDTWKTQPQMLSSDAAYFTQQLADCKVIMEHMDIRLHEYERMGQHLGEVVEQINAMDAPKGNSAAQDFINAARKGYGGMKASKVVEIERAMAMIDDLEQKIQSVSDKKIALSDLDKQIEKVRDVANKQEDQLKRFRGIFLGLSKAASQFREKASDPLKQYVTAIGHDCRKMLRTRGRAE